MDFQGIIEQATITKVVVYGPGTTGAAISQNGGAFAPTTNAPVAISGNYYYVLLTGTETNTLGPLVIRFSGAPAGTAVMLQVRSLIREVGSAFSLFGLGKLVDALGARVGTTLTPIINGIVPKILPTLDSIKRGANKS